MGFSLSHGNQLLATTFCATSKKGTIYSCANNKINTGGKRNKNSYSAFPRYSCVITYLIERMQLSDSENANRLNELIGQQPRV